MACVLIVDDQVSARLLLRTILKHAGHQTLLAEDGLRALEVLQSHPEVDVLITDINMPRLDGFGLLEALKGQPQLIKLVITVQEQPEFRKRVEALGGSGLLAKPFEPKVFDEQLRKLLAQRDAVSREDDSFVLP